MSIEDIFTSRKPLIPFWMYPFSWGLKGKTRDIAQAEYELTGKALAKRLLEINRSELSEKEYKTKELNIKLSYGDIDKHQYDLRIADLIDDQHERSVAILTLTKSGYDLEVAILELDHDFLTGKEYNQRLLKLKLKYKLISDSEYYREQISLIEDPVNRALGELELDLKEDKISHTKYEKEKATLKGEPWVSVLDMSFSAEKPEEGSFELDWNEHFVTSLIDAGYSGATHDQIVNLWFMTVCKNVAMEEFGGLGTFDEDVEANLASQEGNLPAGRKAHK